MNQPLSSNELRPRRKRVFRIAKVISAGLIAALVIATWLGVSGKKTISWVSHERNEIRNIGYAIEAFRLEYGRYPFASGDGRFTDEASQGRLMRVLCGLDPMENPKGIAFFDAKRAKEFPIGSFRSGISPISGAFFDPWGNPYRIIIDTDSNGVIDDPYAEPIRAGVISWSLGKDGKPARLGEKFDDVVSWR